MATLSNCFRNGFMVAVVIYALQAFSFLALSSHSDVKFLPGFQGPLPFQLETGYIGVGESDEVQLFYYFIKSESNPEEDPLILWLNGGPGCSGLCGILFEIGPIKIKVEPYNGSLPTLISYPYAWTKTTSIIFVDSPVGTGFSYALNSHALTTNDFEQVHQLYQFFQKWLIEHPEFLSNPIYIAGDSYSGITGPAVVQEILNENNQGSLPFMNFQGYILGNPRTDYNLERNYRIPYGHGMALISDELYESLKRNCKGEYVNLDPQNVECAKDVDAFQECITGLNLEYILDPVCALASPRPRDMFHRRSLYNSSKVFLDPEPKFGCHEYVYFLSKYWANDPSVQKALRIREGTIGEWLRCNRNLPFNKEISSSFPYHVNISLKGYRSLIYSGDHDMQVPFLSTQAWIRALNYSIVEDWRSWLIEGQIAGYTRTYSNRMTFATVKGAGHVAPEYKSKECFVMFQRWIHGKPL